MNRLFTFLVAGLLLPAAAVGQHGSSDAHSKPYAGFEQRDIKSLSAEDIAELRRGGGWGLALPAELNGKPGPAHLLELKDDLNLSEKQVEQITALFDEMKAEAILAGERLIAAEAALSKAFEADDLDRMALESLVETAEAARADLRFIHLSRHLATVPLLTSDQITQYQKLRGYSPDPCSNIPEGHNPEMWRKHNGCS